MSSDSRVITNYLHVNSAWNFAIYRALARYKNDTFIRNNTLRVLLNSSHDVAVIQWCGLFGSSGSNNPTHWSRSDEPWIKDKYHFTESVLAPLAIAFDEWENYHSQFLIYRNKNVAHIEIDDWHRDVPIFDIALEVLFQSYRIFVGNDHEVYDLSDEYEKTIQHTRKMLSDLGYAENVCTSAR